MGKDHVPDSNVSLDGFPAKQRFKKEYHKQMQWISRGCNGWFHVTVQYNLWCPEIKVLACNDSHETSSDSLQD